jgi:hypothetical protein
MRPAVIFAIMLCCTFTMSSGRADDFYLYDKGGFRINLASNGGSCFGCEWLELSGEIPSDAGEILQKYVTDHSLSGIHFNAVFNSPGGSLLGGIRLGRAIRALAIETSVGKTTLDSSIPGHSTYKTEKGICFSSCAYAFLGGMSRIANAGEYGVHQFYTDSLLKNPDGKVFSPVDFSAQQTVTGLLLSYVIEMGVDAGLVVQANKTDPTDMYLLTDKELIDLRVSFDPKRYGSWKRTGTDLLLLVVRKITARN